MSHAQELKQFATQLAQQAPKEVDSAVALLWFRQHFDPDYEGSARDLAAAMRSLGLVKGQINVGRLKERLKRHKATVSGKQRDYFRIGPRHQSELDEAYLPLLKVRRVEVSDSVLPLSMLPTNRSYLLSLARELNGCYDYGFYDGCAVLCRRVVESLLIDSFVKAGHEDKIKVDKDFMPLSQIIAVAKSKKYFHLAKGMDKVLDEVKDIGDRAAHHRYYITQPNDVDAMAARFRALVSELLIRAGVM